MSLGLIVTELVINGLKHGFPAGAEGEILVCYDAQDSGWRLSVSDNGLGSQGASGDVPHTGLGTRSRRRVDRRALVTISAPAINARIATGGSMEMGR